ncbi:MAG: hypothetical protein WCG27_05285, partial [Pseudomonadota bacterium]
LLDLCQNREYMAHHPFADSCPHESCIIYDNEVIFELCERLLSFQGPLTLTQEHLGKITQKHTAILNFIDYHSQQLIFRPEDLQNKMKFDIQKSINVVNGSENIIFSGQVGTICRPKFLHLRLPAELYLKNNRSNKRHHLEKLQIPVLFTNFTIQDFNMQTINLDAELIDVSITGMSLKINLADLGNHHVNDKVIITSINNKLLENKITGKIVYLRPIKRQNRIEYCKLAVKFDAPLATYQILSYLPKSK